MTFDYIPDMMNTSRAAESKDEKMRGGKPIADIFEKMLGLLLDERHLAESDRAETVEILRDAMRRVADRERELVKKCIEKVASQKPQKDP